MMNNAINVLVFVVAIVDGFIYSIYNFWNYKSENKDWIEDRNMFVTMATFLIPCAAISLYAFVKFYSYLSIHRYIFGDSWLFMVGFCSCVPIVLNMFVNIIVVDLLISFKFSKDNNNDKTISYWIKDAFGKVEWYKHFSLFLIAFLFFLVIVGFHYVSEYIYLSSHSLTSTTLG